MHMLQIAEDYERLAKRAAHREALAQGQDSETSTGACARCQRAADLPAGKHLCVTFARGSPKPLFDDWFFGFSRNRNYRADQG